MEVINIITLTEVKELLQITTTSTDSLIETLIPIVVVDAHEYTKNYFENYDVQVSSSTIAFGSDEITADYDFDDYGFDDDQWIRVKGSYRNNGIYKISSVSSSTITIDTDDSIDSITTEDLDDYVTITKIEYPKALKLIIAKMINHHLNDNKDDIKSESISRYSVTYQDSINGYPKSIISGLNRWRKVVFR